MGHRQSAAPLAAAVAPFVSSGLEAVRQGRQTSESLLAGEAPLRRLARDYLAALLSGDRQRAEQLVMAALDDGTCTLEDLYLEVFQRTQYEIGRLG
jgi:methanogenic corrinoid protein MtbC1